MEPRLALILGAVLAAVSVGAGAFGAHWLESELPRRNLTVEVQQRQLHVWDVAVRYQMYHALGLIAIGLLGMHSPNGLLRLAAVLFSLGIAIFSGCLYALVLSGWKILGAIVPLGGLAMIAGWLVLAFAAGRRAAG